MTAGTRRWRVRAGRIGAAALLAVTLSGCANLTDTQKRVGGLEAFVEPLGAKLLLPPSREQWPKPEFIEAANRFRRVGE